MSEQPKWEDDLLKRYVSANPEGLFKIQNGNGRLFVLDVIQAGRWDIIEVALAAKPELARLPALGYGMTIAHWAAGKRALAVIKQVLAYDRNLAILPDDFGNTMGHYVMCFEQSLPKMRALSDVVDAACIVLDANPEAVRKQNGDGETMQKWFENCWSEPGADSHRGAKMCFENAKKRLMDAMNNARKKLNAQKKAEAPKPGMKKA